MPIIVMLLWMAYVIFFTMLEGLKSIYELMCWLIKGIKEDIEIEKEIKGK